MVTGVRDVGNKRILIKNKNLCLLNLHQNPTPLMRHASWCSKIAYIERQPIFSGGVADKSHTPSFTKQNRVTPLKGPHAAALKSPHVLSLDFQPRRYLINCQTSIIASNVLIEVLPQDFLGCRQVRMLFSTRGTPSVCLASYTPPVAPVAASE